MMNATRMVRRVLSVLTIVSIVLSAAADGVFSVVEGESKSLSGACSYDEIFINGALTIADGAVVTAKRLMMASNVVDATKSAKLTLNGSARLTVTGANGDGLDACLGYGDRAEVVLNGTSMLNTTTAVIHYLIGKDAKAAIPSELEASVTLNDSAAWKNDQKLFVFRGSTSATGADADFYHAEIRLNGSSSLSVGTLIKNSNYRNLGVFFNGGSVKSVSMTISEFLACNQSDGHVVLESVDGHDIIVTEDHSHSTLFAAEAGGWFATKGSGALVLNGAASGSCLFAAGSTYHGKHILGHTGGTRFEKGQVRLTFDNCLPDGTLVVAAGAQLDLRGTSQTVPCVSAAGTIRNSQAAPSVLTVDGDADDSLVSLVGGAVSIVKRGAAVLRVVEGAVFSGLSVEAGEARAVGRNQVGYAYYRFLPTAVYGEKANGGQYNELYLYDGDGTDVTLADAAKSYGKADSGSSLSSKALDGDRTTKYYFDMSTLADKKAWVGVRFIGLKNVRAYSFATGDDFGPIHKYAGRTDKSEPSDYDPQTCRDVCAWILQASTDGSTWVDLDSQSGFVPEDTRNYVYPGFACHYGRASLSIGDVSVSSGARLVVDDTTLCFGTLMRCGAVEFANGGALGGDETGSGSVRLVEGGSFSGDVAVGGGTLRLSGVGSVGPWFRFSITANRDNQNDKVQFAELALYDAYGVRVNGNLEYAGKNKSASNLNPGQVTALHEANNVGERPQSMADGDLTTKCGLYESTKPMPVTMRLSESYAGSKVVSYALATANDHSERDPAGWELLASSDGVTWQVVDTRDLEAVGTNRFSWSAYNGGKPYVVTNASHLASSAFSPASVVSVAGGATLDLSDTETEIGALRVDTASAGTINCFSVAENGVLDVVGTIPAGGSFELPVTLMDVTDGSNFAHWTVKIDGVLKSGYSVSYANGRLTVHKSGIILIVR